MKIIRSFIGVLLLILLAFRSNASHMVGGEITYRCLGGNRFEFTITLYQDCLNGNNNAIRADSPAFYGIFDAVTYNFVDSGTAFASTVRIVPPEFSNDCINNFPNTCLRKETFVFEKTLSPNPNGYIIVYQRCCRNAAINNLIAPGLTGVTYYAHIPGFTSGQCPNNSAVFNNFPPQIICANNPLIYDFSASDMDGDSLSYRLCNAMPGADETIEKPTGAQMDPPPYPSVSYYPPYSAETPMFGFPPIQIEETTGMLTVTPTALGRYVVTVCVDEWRNGVLLNTLSRDVQFVVTNCSKAVVANIPQYSEDFNTYVVQCDGFDVTFDNLSSGGFSYLWRFGVGDATSTEFSPTFTYPDTGVYQVTLVVNPGSTCSDSISRLVKVFPYFNTDFEREGLLCPGDTISFRDLSTSTYQPINRWTWIFGDGDTAYVQNPSHIYRQGGNYNVTLISKNIKGCVDTARSTIGITDFKPFAGNDTIVVLGYPYRLNAQGGDFYSWTPSDYLDNPSVGNPWVTFPDTGRYTYVVDISTETGCQALDTINIWVVKSGSFFLPTAFSPNGDGLNDVFKPILVGYPNMEYLRVYNRWGQQVFITSNVFNGWDGTVKGKPAGVGTYFWEVSVINIDGKREYKKGDVTLIR
jgi:gliding motility-associated-like protein